MAAANTDKFIKVARKWVGQIGAGGVADSSVTTVPLSSTTNLPTDTAVVAVINRVNSAGTKTPNSEETVVGVVSGSNLTNCVRGFEGTAQAHDAGDVVEILYTAAGHNRLIDGLLVAHNQDGTHKTGSVFDLPQINDTSDDHQYIFGVSELTADRTVTLPLLTGDDTFVFQGHSQTLSNKDYRINSAPGTDNTYSGTSISLTAAAATAQWEVGYINSSSKVDLADADAIATSGAIVLATAAISQDAAGVYLLNGVARNDAWNWTPGGLLYLSTTAGAITQAAPSGTDDVIQVLGVALTADIIHWNPQLIQVEHTG